MRISQFLHQCLLEATDVDEGCLRRLRDWVCLEQVCLVLFVAVPLRVWEHFLVVSRLSSGRRHLPSRQNHAKEQKREVVVPSQRGMSFEASQRGRVPSA